MGAVRGIMLDESLLFAEDESGNPYLPSGAAILLRRLQYSKLRVGICHQEDVSPQKWQLLVSNEHVMLCTMIKTNRVLQANFLTRTAASYSFDCISLNASQVTDPFNKLLLSWHCDGEICFYVTSRKDEDLFDELHNQGWRIVLRRSEGDLTENKELLYIDKLEELLITMCRFSKMAMHGKSVLMIGYVMKPSREEDFAKRGAFPMYPTQSGLMFVPLTFELPLASQIQEVDVLLHKATDEIIGIDPCTSFDFPEGITYSKRMCELERYIQDHPDCCIIDPLVNIYPLLDRFRIQQILLGLEHLNVKNHQKIRAPHFLKVDDFHGPKLAERLSEAKLSFPNIVKPQVACGVADAHNMALVFKIEDFRELCVPLPAIVQEYVDHGSSLYKFYVLGEKVFYAVKKSMPNANVLLSSSEQNGFAPIIFDSLKSLPIANEDQPSIGGSKSDKQSLDVELLNDAANWLRKRLCLTIFGFDVVIQEGSGDHVIVDLNYLPSFKEVPDSDAIPAFWDAIKCSYDSRRAK